MSHPHARTQEPTHAEAPPDPRRWLALVLLCLAQFMLILDVTVVNVALPSIGADLGLGRESLTWVVTAYALCFGGLMLLGGRLADVVGRRRILLAGLGLFTLASLASSLALNGEMLVAGRALQGVGAALLSPAALSTITTTFHGAERNRALGVWAAIGGSGAAMGVLLGGVLTAGPGWAWVFFVNVPVGVAVFAGIPVVVAADGPRTGHRRLDLAGALAVTTGTALLVYGFVTAGRLGWTAVGTLVPIAGAALAYAAFVMIERAVRNPLVRLELLTRRPVVSGTFVMLVASGLLIAFFFLSSLYLQRVLGYGALRTGLLFLPVAVAITAGAHLGGRLIGRFGGRPVAAAGLVLTAVGAALLTQLSARDDALTNLLPGFLIAAFGIGPAFVAATATTMANVARHEAGLASGVVNTFHELGGALGVAVVSALAAGSIADATGSTSDVGGFADAFLLATIVAAVGAVGGWALLPAGRPPADARVHVQ